MIQRSCGFLRILVHLISCLFKATKQSRDVEAAIFVSLPLPPLALSLSPLPPLDGVIFFEKLVHLKYFGEKFFPYKSK